MAKCETDSIGQFRPKDNITIQYRERGGGEVVWQNSISIPQWRSRFENSPLMPPRVMLDTNSVEPGDPKSHITIRAPHIGEDTKTVPLDENGTGTTALPDDVTVIVDATALTTKYRNPGSIGSTNAATSSTRHGGVISFRS